MEISLSLSPGVNILTFFDSTLEPLAGLPFTALPYFWKDFGLDVTLPLSRPTPLTPCYGSPSSLQTLKPLEPLMSRISGHWTFFYCHLEVSGDSRFFSPEIPSGIFSSLSEDPNK